MLRVWLVVSNHLSIGDVNMPEKLHLSDRNTNNRFSNNYKFTSNLAQNIISLKLHLNVNSITKQEADEIVEHLTIHFENFVEYLEDAVKLTESQALDVPHLGEE